MNGWCKQWGRSHLTVGGSLGSEPSVHPSLLVTVRRESAVMRRMLSCPAPRSSVVSVSRRRIGYWTTERRGGVSVSKSGSGMSPSPAGIWVLLNWGGCFGGHRGSSTGRRGSPDTGQSSWIGVSWKRCRDLSIVFIIVTVDCPTGVFDSFSSARDFRSRSVRRSGGFTVRLGTLCPWSRLYQRRGWFSFNFSGLDFFWSVGRSISWCLTPNASTDGCHLPNAISFAFIPQTSRICRCRCGCNTNR